MRIIGCYACLLLLASSAVARGQSFLLQGSAGPTLNDRGFSVAAGAGFSPNPRLSLLVDIERTQLFSRSRSDGHGGFSAFRGGTLTLVSPQVRLALRGSADVGPYGLVGFAAGVSRPTVNDMFPDSVTHAVGALFVGGGINVPLSESITVIADVRMTIGAEAGELLAVVPLRGGLAWRF